MIMEPRCSGFSGSLSAFRFDDETLLPYSDQHPNFANGFKANCQSSDFCLPSHPFLPSDPALRSSTPCSRVSAEADSPSDDGDCSEAVFKYISQMLLEEEDIEERPFVSHDPLALQAAEKSLYEVLGETHHPSELHHFTPFMDSPDNNYSGNSSDCDGKSSPSSIASGSNSVDPLWMGDLGDSRSSVLQYPIMRGISLSTTNVNAQPSSLENCFVSNTNRLSGSLGDIVPQSSVNANAQTSFPPQNNLLSNANRMSGPLWSAFLVPQFSTEGESVIKFQRGLEEANRFLPKGNQLFFDLERSTIDLGLKARKPMNLAKVETRESKDLSPNGIRGKKNHGRDDPESEDSRSNKQSAIYVDDTELSEMLDRVLLCNPGDKRPGPEAGDSSQRKVRESLEQNGQAGVSNDIKARSKKPSSHKIEAVDLRTLLILCAQAVTADDRRTANDYLKQIRQHSSPSGDGSQRLAHCLANALEARLEGTGAQIYAALASQRISVVDILKAHKLHRTACPFQKIATIFANHMILDLAEKASTLHIIDFGILYGFQWPALISRLSRREGGPPKLRITGIEFPQRGFRPAERVQQTGHRLARFCERFKVPFEYNAIAQKWERIKIEDLKIRDDESIAVNTLFRFKNLLDETVVLNNPRDTVLNLIRKIKPHLFVQAIVNGSFSVPFFVTRFREALFHYSAMFDAFDTSLSLDDPIRLMYEKEFFGREAINAIACEGPERVERPETYKQWQIRNMRAGFRQLPLDPLLMKKLRTKLKEGYHEDFIVDEDGHWMLQGWKGRILYASSSWVPA